jgi:N-acetylmuramoyl-L-alanine amidase
MLAARKAMAVWGRPVASALLLHAWLAAQSLNPASVREVRYSSHGDYTRILVELSAVADFKHDRLPNPDRVFVDLSQTVPRNRGGAEIVPVRDRFVKQVRVAENQPGRTRIVFDLANTGVDYTVSRLANPERLVVEFFERGRSSGRRTTPPQLASRKRPEIQAASILLPPVVIPRYAWESLPKMGRDPDALPRPAPPSAAQAKSTTANGEHSMIRALGLKVGRIVIDAGHGGSDHGTTGPTGLREKDVVLDVAKRLGTLLEAQLGCEVIYTRVDDSFVALEDRPRIANERKADLFISVHANSSPVAPVTGVETFYLNFDASPSAMEVAARENATARKNVSELQDLLQKIALNTKVRESADFASKVQAAQVVGAARGRDRGVKRAPFVVLIGTEMPAILTEIGFLSNAREEAQFKKPEHRQKVAEAIARGIVRYSASLSHFQLANQRPPSGSED